MINSVRVWFCNFGPSQYVGAKIWAIFAVLYLPFFFQQRPGFCAPDTLCAGARCLGLDSVAQLRASRRRPAEHLPSLETVPQPREMGRF